MMTVVTEALGSILAYGEVPALVIAMLKSCSPSSTVSLVMDMEVQRTCSVVSTGKTIASELPSHRVSSPKTVNQKYCS